MEKAEKDYWFVAEPTRINQSGCEIKLLLHELLLEVSLGL